MKIVNLLVLITGFTTLALPAVAKTPARKPASFVSSATLPPELLTIQRQLFTTAFASFVKDLRSAHANLDLGSDPLAAPDYDPHLTREQWLDLFAATVASANQMSSADAEKLKGISEDQFTSYYHDKGYARVPFMQLLTAKKEAGSPDVKSVDRLQLPTQYPGHHTLDVATYVNERFPLILQAFVKTRKVALFIENSSCDDVVAYQKSQGFAQAVRFMGPRDDPDSQFIFVYNGKNYRLAVCDIHGADDQTRIGAILGPTFAGIDAFAVHHTHPAPLFNFNSIGASLKLNPQTDRVIIGFQNTVWWQLKTTSDDWTRASITKSGAEVALFQNARTGQRVISVASVYGDETTEALQTFYDLGARKFNLLGTAGGIDPLLEIGDVIFPNRFLKPDGTWINFANDVEHGLFSLNLPQKIVHETAQGWVPTLVAETIDYITALKTHGAQALDVEARYFAEFFATHAATEKSIVITISDQPLGHTNYKQENATRNIPMKSITTLVPQLLH